MPADLASLLRLEVPLIVQLAEQAMPVQQVVALVPGSIIEFAAVKVGENYGIRVSRLGDLRRRLEAIGVDEAPTAGVEPAPEPKPEPDIAA
jgi:hypothetical protein